MHLAFALAGFAVLASVLWFLWCELTRVAPGPRLLLPLVGDWTTFFARITGKILPRTFELFEKYGPVVQTTATGIFSGPEVFVFDPDLCQLIVNDVAHFPDRGTANPIKLVAPEGLVVLPTDKKWKVHRALVSSLLTNKRWLASHVESIEVLADRACELLQKKKEVEIFEFLNRVTFQVICKVGFDYDTTSFEDDSIMKAFRTFLFEMFLKWLVPVIFSLTESSKRFNNSLRMLRELALSASTGKVSLDEDQVASGNFAAVLKNSGKLSESEMMDETLTMLLAGHGATGSTLSWIMYMLSLNQEVQEKLYLEIADLCKPGYHLTFEDLNEGKLPYLEAVMMESMRCNPTVGGTMRECKTATQIGSMKIPKGSSMLLVYGTIALSEKYWEEPLRFNPDRFLGLSREEELRIQSKLGFRPFGGGRRVCVGQRLSFLQMKLMLCKLLSKFRFELDISKPRPVQILYGIMAPERGIYVVPVLRDH